MMSKMPNISTMVRIELTWVTFSYSLKDEYYHVGNQMINAKDLVSRERPNSARIHQHLPYLVEKVGY
jgi:hypothetical protein